MNTTKHQRAGVYVQEHDAMKTTCKGCDGRGEVGRMTWDGWETETCPFCHGFEGMTRKKWKRIQVQIQKRRTRGASHGCPTVPAFDLNDF